MRYRLYAKRNVSGRFFLLPAVLSAILTAGIQLSFCAGDPKENAREYLWPTNASRSLSSTFAESRDTHYHSGLDIRTNHTEGYPCYAVADGDIVRIRVSPYGYGKVLYLQLHDGRTAVYAHLQRFGPRIEEIVKAWQYEQHSFRCHLFFEPGELPFDKGEIVAYTGSTGIGHPHLHFEMRSEVGYINPMTLGFTVADTRAPRPERVTVFPLDVDAEVDGGFDGVSLPIRPLVGKGSNYYEATKIPSIYGTIGLGITGDDHTNAAYNPVCFYGLDLILDDSLVFSARYDAITYQETKQIHLERDFRLQRNEDIVSNHLWQDPLITADFYSAGEGLINTNDLTAGLHDFEIIVHDYMKNSAHVLGSLNVQSQPVYPQVKDRSLGGDFFDHHTGSSPTPSSTASKHANLKTDFYDDYVVFRVPKLGEHGAVQLSIRRPYRSIIPLIASDGQWVGKLPLRPELPGRWLFDLCVTDQNGTVRSDTSSIFLQPILKDGGIAISEDGRFYAEFEPRATYKTTYTRVYAEDPPPDEHFASKVYHLYPHDVPIRSEAGVSIRILPEEQHPEQLGIYSLTRKGEWEFIDNDRRTVPGSVYGWSPQLETYVLIRDAEPPELRWLSPKRSTKNPRPTLRLRVEDNFSIVDDRTMSLEIDGEWVLMEYDFENDLMFGRPEEPLSPGEHRIEVRVRDYCGNEAQLSRTLTILKQ